MRWLKELLKPALKCERLGHDWKRKTLRAYQWPGEGYRSVADEVTFTIHECQRCQQRERREGDEVITREGIQSLSMPSEDWRKLKRDGVLEL